MGENVLNGKKQLKKDSLVSIIIPVYNEIKNLPRLEEVLLSSMGKSGYTYEIIFIDDNSQDGTYEYLLESGKKNPISVYRKSGKKGKAYSLMEGFKRAKGTILGMIDA